MEAADNLNVSCHIRNRNRVAAVMIVLNGQLILIASVVDRGEAIRAVYLQRGQVFTVFRCTVKVTVPLSRISFASP